MVKTSRNETTGQNGRLNGDPSMIKALSAVAVAAFFAAALTVLPGFAPTVEASCLRRAGSKTTVREARLVTAARTP